MIEAIDTTQNDALELPLRAVIEGKPKSFLIHINKLKDETGRADRQ